ncbi:MAG TPA: SAM-dependent methyltransferase [Cytophagales bacterium]|nr:SAM-dependent methyltransferase [Cytophagales bacterium]HAA23226.1 SAM-dependent methyltransferase [Cytophagales bacterium]HAP58486.1 SAM-dependent methyltransferase [Cytophagales bacterium]
MGACQSVDRSAPSISPAYNLPASDTRQTNTDPFGQLVDQYEAPIRLDWQQPERVLAMVEPLPGKKVADIGAGTGFFSFRLLEAGASVIAIDIDPRFLQFIEQRRDEGPDSLANKLEVRLAKPNAPPLVKEEVDGVLVVNTYNFIQNRIEYFTAVREGMKRNAWLLIVEYKPGPLPVGPAEEEKIASSLIIQELKSAGFSEVTIETKVLPYQNIYLARGYQQSTDTITSIF